MIDEFKIRSQVAGIEASPKPPMQKARLILRLARRIRAAARSLGALSHRSFREGDTLRAARMREGAERLIDAHVEVRAKAGEALKPPAPLGEGDGPSIPAYVTFEGPLAPSPSPPEGRAGQVSLR